MLKIKNISLKSLWYLIMFGISAFVFVPIISIILGSFKNNREVFTRSPLSLPTEFLIENYTTLFISDIRFGRYFFNSFFVTFLAIILILTLAAFASYGLAKYKFAGNRIILLFFMLGLFLPMRLGTLNIVQIIFKLGLYNNLFALIILYIAAGMPLAVFIITDFIKLLPDELSNAARVDGCSEMGIFFRIILPNIFPALTSVAIFQIIWIWNDFWWPLILIHDNSLRTVPFAAFFFIGQYHIEYGKIYAITSVATLPTIIIYLFLSRYYVKGLLKGAIKG